MDVMADATIWFWASDESWLLCDVRGKGSAKQQPILFTYVFRQKPVWRLITSNHILFSYSNINERIRDTVKKVQQILLHALKFFFFRCSERTFKGSRRIFRARLALSVYRNVDMVVCRFIHIQSKFERKMSSVINSSFTQKLSVCENIIYWPGAWYEIRYLNKPSPA